MPLSEHEQKVLAELEESLVREDPGLAERVRSETVYKHAGRYCKWSALTFIVGLIMLVGFYSTSVLIGFVGVAVMFGSLVIFERNMRRMGKAGWHDFNRYQEEARTEWRKTRGHKTPQGESSRSHSQSSDGTAGIENAVNDIRDWLRTHFNRRQP